MSIRRSIPLTVLVVVALAQPAFAALPVTSEPTIQLDRTIRTTPFVNSSVSMRDGEGNAYVPGDDSLWLVEDHDNSAFEVDPTTGALKRVITSAAFQDAPRFGGGTVAGANRTEDFEAMAYDASNDVLYVFSGPCCDSSVLPTAFRLRRQSGTFQVESYQPLPAGSDFTAAAWNPSDGLLYVGHGAALRTYDYEANTPGPTFSVTNLSGITGMVFSQADDDDLFVSTNAERIRRVDWATKTLVPGWTFDLTPFSVKDSRAVELIRDQFYVLDGYDSRPTGDPLRFAVFVFDVLGPGPTPPNASFTAAPTSGPPPLDVTFTDTSSGAEGWLWDFGDGSPTSTEQHPTHTYSAEGTFTVTLTASNTVGTDTATRTITVSEQPPPSGNLVGNPGFEADVTGWSTAGSGAEVTMERDALSHSGSWSAKLANGGLVSRKCVLNDSPNWVTSTPAPSYTASAWVRGETAGKRISILLRELSSSGAVLGSRVRRFTLSTSWQEITVSWTPGSPTSSLDLQLFLPRAQAPPGTCFYADDISIIGS